VSNLRLRQRRLLFITCAPTVPVQDVTGGISRLEKQAPYRFNFLGILLPPQRRVTRTAGGVRLAVTWQVLADGFPEVKEQDHLYFPNDNRTYVVTAIRRGTRFLSFTVERKL
jgi:hypothetical protein